MFDLFEFEQFNGAKRKEGCLWPREKGRKTEKNEDEDYFDENQAFQYLLITCEWFFQ